MPTDFGLIVTYCDCGFLSPESEVKASEVLSKARAGLWSKVAVQTIVCRSRWPCTSGLPSVRLHRNRLTPPTSRRVRV